MKRLDDIPGTIELDSPAIRAIAAGADDLTHKTMPLAELWKQLVSGALRIVDSFHSDQRCYLTLTAPATVGKPPRRLSARKVETLQRILLGERQKTVALDCNLAASTIALTVAECLRTLGLDSRTARVPALVALAAHAARGETETLECKLSDFVLPASAEGARERGYLVVSVERPDLEIGGSLSAAEYAVARLLVEGKSYAEMAVVRGTSVRTVANQVASVFQKVGVSGRSEFLSSLVRAGRPQVSQLPPVVPQTAPATNVVPLRSSERRVQVSRPLHAMLRAESPRWESSGQRDVAPNSTPLSSKSGSALAAR
jgi:DNA-binding NarL/FixJ family response regulator